MPITHKELEEEIARLSKFINRQVDRSQRLIAKAEIYLDNDGTLREVIENYKPNLKKSRLKLEISALKLRLKVLKYQIRQRQAEQSDQAGASVDDKKKGGV